MIKKTDKIYIAGHNGMVGSACWRLLISRGYNNLVGYSSNECDLRIQKDVEYLFNKEKPNVVINAAAKVGGILANSTQPFEFLLDNMQIQNNILNSAVNNGVRKFLFLGSSCIYPKMSPQPIKEEFLLSDQLEETNQWYALAKITGIKLIESIRKTKRLDYFSLMPTNLFGPGDNYDLNTSHVIPALIKKFSDAVNSGEKSVEIWGSGSPKREFMHVDDLASVCLLILESNTVGEDWPLPIEDSFINVGSEYEISIKELAQIIAMETGFKGDLIFNTDFPDGTPRKLLDSRKLKLLGWQPQKKFKDSLSETIRDYQNRK